MFITVFVWARYFPYPEPHASRSRAALVSSDVS